MLDIGEDEILTEELLKRKYRMKALQFHPDKNPATDASTQFQQIHEAFETLSKPTPVISYLDMLADFLKSANVGECRANWRTEETDFIWRVLKRVDRRSLETMRDLLSDVVLHEINVFLSRSDKKRELDTERVVLKPTLSDLFADNLYKLTIENRQFLIPLWYDELVYDVSGADLVVQCCPELPANVAIDATNNITVSVRLVAGELIGKTALDVVVGGRILTINPAELKLVKIQNVIMKNAGVSRINRRDVYNVSDRANVVITIELV